MAKRARRVASNVAASPESRPTATDPDRTEIAALAYQLWFERGCPNGSDQEDWYRAEGMLKSRGEDTKKKGGAASL